MRRRKMHLASRILSFAQDLAATGLLPRGGIEIFRSQAGRFIHHAHVFPDGALSVSIGSYMGGGSWRGREARDFRATSDELLSDIVCAVQSGIVWSHILDGMRPPIPPRG